MRNKQPTTSSMQKSGSAGMSQIRNFSNYNGTLKSRTQHMTPYNLSPPAQINIRDNSSKATTDVGKNGNDQQRMYYRNLDNYPGTIVKKQEKRDFVSMDEVLGFLSFINTRSGEAFRGQNITMQQMSQGQSQRPTRRSTTSKQQDFTRKSSAQRLGGSSETLNPSNMISQNEGEQQQILQEDFQISDTKKKLNKNRAIKRIIQTSFDLLQKNYRFTSSQQQPIDHQRSTSTQFNIYLKQYNRIIEQINSKQYEQISKFNLEYEKNEEELQDVFEYTVMDDFREKLQVTFSKEKVSKNNVNIVITAFRQALVMLRVNQIKIQYTDSQQAVKSIKMSEVQNVQYFTHPYIFIVLTINRDKTKSKQHLYLKFSSQQNQDKWDRALYCCYMSRKMKKKGRLFEIEFPVEDVMKKEKEEYKKEEEFYILNEELTIVQKCFNQPIDTQSLVTNYDNEGQRNLLSERSQYMNLPKDRNFTEDKIKISIHNPDNLQDARRLNTMQNKTSKYDNPFKVEMNTVGKNDDVRNEALGESVMSFGQSRNISGNADDDALVDKEGVIFTPNQMQSLESGNLSKKSTFYINQNNNNTLLNLSPVSPKGSQTPLSKSQNPFMKLLRVKQPQTQKQQQKQNPTKQSTTEQTLKNNFELNQKMLKLKRIRELQKLNVRGIVCQKQKFFMNKEKIVFFHDQSMTKSSRQIDTQLFSIETLRGITSQHLQANKFLQYWDYDYKNDQREQKKLIALSSILDYQLIPSQLAQTTTTVLISYNVGDVSKVDKKQLRLIFANSFTQVNTGQAGQSNKAHQIIQWIKIVKNV